MKKLLLFFIAVATIILCCGGELEDCAADFGVSEYACYESDEGELLGQTITLTDCELTEREILYKLGAVYHFNSKIEDISIIYGYSPRLKHLVFIDNKPVNFQLTFSKNTVTVSNPVNLGSF